MKYHANRGGGEGTQTGKEGTDGRKKKKISDAQNEGWGGNTRTESRKEKEFKKKTEGRIKSR